MSNALDLLKNRAVSMGMDKPTTDGKEKAPKKEEIGKGSEKNTDRATAKGTSRKGSAGGRKKGSEKRSDEMAPVKKSVPEKVESPKKVEEVEISSEDDMDIISAPVLRKDEQELADDPRKKITKTFTVTKEVIDKLRFISAMYTLEGETFSISSYVNDLIESDIDRKLKELGLMEVYLKRKKK